MSRTGKSSARSWTGQEPAAWWLRRGVAIARWGDPARPEMAFSATKSVLSLVAGVAFDDGLLRLDEPVCQSVSLPRFTGAHGQRITWRHLLDQTSQWEGKLWGKPTAVDAQSTREGTESAGGPPGAGWAYNDVRVNLTALALTALFRRPLPEVLRSRVMEPVGASSPWSWHGYTDSIALGSRRRGTARGGVRGGGTERATAWASLTRAGFGQLLPRQDARAVAVRVGQGGA